jgi:hypothetical protein
MPLSPRRYLKRDFGRRPAASSRTSQLPVASQAHRPPWWTSSLPGTPRSCCRMCRSPRLACIPASGSRMLRCTDARNWFHCRPISRSAATQLSYIQKAHFDHHPPVWASPSGRPWTFMGRVTRPARQASDANHLAFPSSSFSWATTSGGSLFSDRSIISTDSRPSAARAGPSGSRRRIPTARAVPTSRMPYM